jgi:hypothetical protein
MTNKKLIQQFVNFVGRGKPEYITNSDIDTFLEYIKPKQGDLDKVAYTAVHTPKLSTLRLFYGNEVKIVTNLVGGFTKENIHQEKLKFLSEIQWK